MHSTVTLHKCVFVCAVNGDINVR